VRLISDDFISPFLVHCWASGVGNDADTLQMGLPEKVGVELNQSEAVLFAAIQNEDSLVVGTVLGTTNLAVQRATNGPPVLLVGPTNPLVSTDVEVGVPSKLGLFTRSDGFDNVFPIQYSQVTPDVCANAPTASNTKASTINNFFITLSFCLKSSKSFGLSERY
jgi:hypothetical protein